MIWWAGGGVLGLILLAIWAITVLDMVRRHLGPGPTAAWLIIVLLLPFAGAVLYWVLRKPSPEEIQRQADNELALRQSAARRGFDQTGIAP
jgi:hypothetical protein